jgi:hypothetical protein
MTLGRKSISLGTKIHAVGMNRQNLNDQLRSFELLFNLNINNMKKQMFMGNTITPPTRYEVIRRNSMPFSKPSHWRIAWNIEWAVQNCINKLFE